MESKISDDLASVAIEREARVFELVDGCATTLGLSGGADLQRLRKSIGSAYDIYQTENYARTIDGSPKNQKKLLRQLLAQLTLAIESLRDLDPAYAVAISELSPIFQPEGQLHLIRFESDALALALGIDQFLESYVAPKGAPTNLALELAIREILPLIEEYIGRATITWNKDNERGPQPNSASAKAVVQMMRDMDPALSQTAILNMIDKVQKRSEISRDPIDAVIRTHFDELDASLLPGRHSDH